MDSPVSDCRLALPVVATASRSANEQMPRGHPSIYIENHTCAFGAFQWPQDSSVFGNSDPSKIAVASEGNFTTPRCASAWIAWMVSAIGLNL